MRPESLELESKSLTPVSQSILQKLKSSSPNGFGTGMSEDVILGGVIRDGQLGWIAIGSNIEILSLRTGQRVAGQTFDEKSIVTCVAEVTANGISSCLLIIAVERAPVGGLLYLFSVQGSRIVHRIDVYDKITSCCFISDDVCKRCCLKAFNGCAVVGTDAGEVFLIDLHLNRCKNIISRQTPYNQHTNESSIKIVSAPIDENAIRHHVKVARSENINPAICLDFSVVQQPSAISSILSMPQTQMVVVGLESGLLALFNLCDLSALHLAYPPEIDSPLVKLSFLEPADDPRPCIYIWAFHANKNNFPFAVMHSVSFNSKVYQDGENIYEAFQWCRPDLTIPIHEQDSTPIACQSVTKLVIDEEDEQYSLCLLAWTNRMSSFVLIFDLNQWYKEQMPRVCDWRDYPSYLAPFPIEMVDGPLDIWLSPKSVATFNSIQRPEEHFYPTSLSFDLIQLRTANIQKLHWGGLQNNAIKKLSNTGAVAILMPDECFSEFLEASLIPQLSDQNYHENPSKKLKQEFLLSMALEYNCMRLLRDCAQQWADGSHMGRNSGDGLTLSTLTEWIWCQANLIKDRCNDLCVSLFDDSGITIDLRSRKILAHYSRQLKLLADLLHMIITTYRQYIPDEIFDTLIAQRNSIRMTSEYQEVLQWLLNMGLLPEIVWNQLLLPEPRNDTFTAIPYPYRILNKFYTEQRQRFYDIDRNNIMPKTKSCKFLYIDSFIDRECHSQLLRNEWNNGLGDGLYPPPSLQAMLRILLIPGISLENKYILFVYLFLDLHMILESEHFNVVQNLIKFPAVFNLNSSLIKTTQAFWNLDHNEYEIALKELISPLTSDRFIAQWQQELLVNTLLIRDMPNLALQAIRAPGPSISTTLRIKTLLANNLITEAFELQRTKFDEQLLLEFFKGCHENKKWKYVLGLSLTEREGDTLCKFLKTCNSLLSENLQLLYLLQRNRYIEALMYLDELKYKQRTLTMQRKLENTQDLIISSYKLAMNSTNRSLCDQYMAIKNRLDIDVNQNSETSPLSSQLNPYIVDTNSNVIGSVFHRAIVSAKCTGFDSASQKNYIPLLGNIRIELISEGFDDCKPVLDPKPYIGLLKRRKEITYENAADPDQKQPAAKRQRTDSFSIADVAPLKKHAPGINSFLLNSLTNQSQIAKKHISRQDLDDTIDVEPEQRMSRNSHGELSETVNLLSTPVVKSSRLDKQSRIDSRCQTPQSILKQRHTEMGSITSRRSTSPSLTVHSARRSVDFNAKQFCYTIPSSQNDEYRLGAIHETPNIQEDDDLSSLNSPNSIRGRRPIHSGKNSTASNSIDEFYSPNTSKAYEESPKESSQDIQNDNFSHMAMPTSTSNIKSRQGLMSSPRITRSRSKLNLEDCVDHENITQKPILNTSTPKRATPKRSSSRSLSKNIITTNALKAQSEADKSTRVEELQRYTLSPENSGSLDLVTDTKQRNFLKDASEMSMKQTSLRYSHDELDANNLKYDLLQDSTRSTLASNQSECDVAEKHFESDVSMEEQDRSIEQEIQKKIEEAAEEQSKEINELQMDENSTVEHSIENIENEPKSDQIHENIEIIPDASSSNDITVSAQPTIEVKQMIMEEATITMTRKTPQSYLIDSSVAVNESIMQKFVQYEHCTSSSFFSDSTHAQNLLEDSSIVKPQSVVTTDSNADSEKDVVNLEEFDDYSRSESSSNNSMISSEQSSDNELQGDNLVYEDSDESDNEKDKNNGSDEVIHISSSSDDEIADYQSKKSFDDIQITDSQDQPHDQYDLTNYEINDDVTENSQPHTTEYELPVDDCNMPELQSASLQLQLSIPRTDTATQSLITQEQAINEMIYGDLFAADAEMLDLDVHNEAFGFEMHGDRGEHNQGSVFEAVELANREQMSQLNESSSDQTIQKEYQQITVIEDEKIVSQEQSQQDMIDRNVLATVGADDEANQLIKEPPERNIFAEDQQSKVDEVIVEAQPPAVETNDLDKAVIIEDNSASVDNTELMLVKQSENTNINTIESMEITEIEQTNIFENAVITSTSIASERATSGEAQQTQGETEHTVDVKQIQPTEDGNKTLVEKDDLKKRKSPARRIRRAASQQEATKEDEVKQPNKEKEREEGVTETKTKFKTTAKQKMKKAASQQNLSSMTTAELSTKIKSRSIRAKSQQPVKSGDVNRKKRGDSKQREFSIIIKRLESEQSVDEPKSEEPIRKKSDASQQKKLLTGEVASEERPSTSKATKRSRTKSVNDTDLGNKFDAEETASSRRLRKATSHQSLSSIVEDKVDESVSIKRSKSPSMKKSETMGPRRAASHQSLSSISDSGNLSDVKETTRYTKRAKSMSLQDVNNPTSSRTRRTISQQNLNDIHEKVETKKPQRKKIKSESTDSHSELGDKFDANESGLSRRLRKAISHHTLSKIEESIEDSLKKGKLQIKKELVTPKTTRRASSIQSLSSAVDDDEIKNALVEVPKTRSRKMTKSETSDKADDEKSEIKTKSPKTRTRRAPSETKQSPTGSETKESHKTKRSNKKDDDSDASSVISTRSRKTTVNTDDETSSVKSTRVRTIRSGSVLTAIAEDDDQAVTSNLPQEYFENSRLTRSQRATIEKYSKFKKMISTDSSTSRRKTSKTKANSIVDEEQIGSEHSDSESVISQKSTVSKASKKSKTSETSSSQRTTRQRTQKK